MPSALPLGVGRWTFGVGRFPQRKRISAFTLLELLVVIGIIAVLLVAVVPAVTSLSKSSGRKGAISNLLGAVEQARSLAIKDGRNTYVAFVTSGVPTALAKDYEYRAYAIFEDDANNPPGQVQVTNWNKLPTGVSFRATNNVPGTSVTVNGYPLNVSFTPGGTGSKVACNSVQFGSTGEVQSPTATPLILAVFEGLVNGGIETVTSGKGANGEPLSTEYIGISHLTGRAEPTAAPTP